MRKKLHFLLMLAAILLFFSCRSDEIDIPQVSSYNIVESAYMADSVPFSVTVSAEYPMNKVQILFYFDDVKVAENIIPVNKSGTYGGKLYVPYVKNVSNSTAELRMVAVNKNFDFSTKSAAINVLRPLFPYLMLKTAYGDFRMEPVDGEPFNYAVSYEFPTQELNGIIEAPAYGENGNSFYFGGTTIKANALETDSIPFLTDEPVGTEYTVSFNTGTYEALPFVKPSFDGVEFPEYADGIAVVEKNLVQNQAIRIRGFLDIADWWIDPTFLDDNEDGTYKFRAMDGKYRVTADRNLNFFRIEPMNNDALADFDPSTKTGGVWVNGGIGSMPGSAPAERLGIPSMSANPCSWNPEKNFAMAPMGDGIYQVKLIADMTLFRSNVSGSNVGIGFYQNSRSLSSAFSLKLVQTLYGSPGVPESSGGSARFEYNAGTSDSNGPIIVSGSNRTLGAGRTYVFTLDTNFTPAEVSISLE